jgi:hypothetical protein
MPSNGVLRPPAWCALIASFAFLGSPFQSQAQSVSSQTASLQDENQLDARLYAVLFRRVNLLGERAASAKSADAPEAGLPRVMPRQLNLSSFDAAALVRLSGAWYLEAAPIQTKIAATVKDFRSSLHDLANNAEANADSAAQLQELQSELRAVTLRYRDALRNSMRNGDYQAMHTTLVQRFATTTTHSGTANSETTGAAK